MQISLFENIQTSDAPQPPLHKANVGRSLSERPVRVPTLCSFCSYGCTLEKSEYGDAESWCSNDKYELQKGFNAWPKILDCNEWKPDRDYYPGEIRHWIFFWKAAALNNKLIDLSVKQLMLMALNCAQR